MKFNIALFLALFEMAEIALASALRGEKSTALRIQNRASNDNEVPNSAPESDGERKENRRLPKSDDGNKKKEKKDKKPKKPKSKDDQEDDADDDTQCSPNESCTPIVLSLTLDEVPSENGYKLICNDETIWDVPFGSFPPSDFQFATVTDTACIYSSSSCVFTILDSYGDGITSPFDGQPGSLKLQVGGTTEIEYDGAGNDSEFTEIQYPAFKILNSCGEDNDDETDDETDDSANNIDAEVKLKITLDEFPTETGYNLVCNDEMIWDVPQGTFPQSDPFDQVSDDATVKSSACCTFTIYDSPTFGDGLTSPQEGKPGKFELKYNNEKVAKYGGKKDGGYTELSYKLGNCYR